MPSPSTSTSGSCAVIAPRPARPTHPNSALVRSASFPELMHPLIRQYYQTFNSGDREALLALLHPDIVHEINEGGVEVGIPAFRAFLGRMDRSYR
ncbi:MAG: nuclear transport factor 2 family protein, partial [Verrucomicrobiota bacterium]